MSGEMVTFAANGGTASGYLAKPAGGGPGIIVLQEYWGLVPHIKDVADRFAAQGFVALAPDLYHGQATTHPDEASRLAMALNITETEKDLRGAAGLLKTVSATRKLGSIGFCMGGSLALLAATLNPDFGACVDFYGANPRIKPEFGKLKCPVLGLWGADDAHIPQSRVNELEAAIKAAGRSCEMHVYPGAGHAFFNDARPEAYNEAAAEDAWKRTLAFFRQHLT